MNAIKEKIEWLDKQELDEQLRKAVNYYKNGGERFWTYLNDGASEMHNNAAERVAKSFATSEIYGKTAADSKALLEDESEIVLGPVTASRWSYATAKLLTERYLAGLADLNWTVLFSDVFKSHSVEEAEDIFICGTHHTTPSASEVSKDWPHPWLYSRVLFMFGIAFALLWVCCDMFQNYNALPGLIVVGSFAVPLSTMILFLEVNAWRICYNPDLW